MVNLNKYIGISLVAAAVLGLSGCSVATEKLTPKEVQESTKKVLTQLKTPQKGIEAPISIDEAIDRAIQNNRDHKLKMLEATFEEKQLAVAQHGMWPSLNAQGAYTNRSNVLASKSEEIATGRENLDYSTSTDDTLQTAEARFSWNALDFGLSYVRAKQQSDKFLIAQERKRKISNQIEQDVREAYWKAVSAQNLLDQINPVINDVRKSIAESKQLEEAKMGNMMESLNYRRELLDVLVSLQNLKKDLLNAKPRLAALMGLAPGTKFELSGQIDETGIQKVNVDTEKMEELAFTHRPELMESRYQERVSLQEAKAAMLSLLPGISFDAGVNYTSNSYTYNNSWFDYGVRINMNLFKVFMAGDVLDRAEAGEKVAQEQNMAVSMAVLTQVHLANIRYQEALEGWDSANQYYTVARKISNITEQANANKIGSKQQAARDKLSKLIANVKRDMAFAELQNSYGNLYFSMGLSHNSAEIEKVVSQ
jgi:outer membrane protein TolC